jgi:hypothetical protein
MSCYIDQMAQPELLPDEVWAQLRPADARLTSFSYARLWPLGAAVVLVAICAALTAASGFLTPQLNDDSSTATGDLGSRTFTQSVELHNDGWFTEHIDRIDTTAPGLRVTGHSGGLVIGSGKGATLQVSYQVTDCSVVQRDQPIPMLLRLRRPWGHRTTTLEADSPSGLAWIACHGAA